MRVFIQDIHPTLTISFGKAFHSMGVKMFLPGRSFEKIIKYGKKWTQEEIDKEINLKNVFAIEYDEILKNPPDILIVTCFEVYDDILKNIWRIIMKKNKRLLFYSGNDGTLLSYLSFKKKYCKNIICADLTSYILALKNDLNTLYYFPWIDYENLKFSGTSDKRIICSYINYYSKIFSFDFNIAKNLMGMFPDIEWRCVENQCRNTVVENMRNSLATLHIKYLEGYGFSIIESLAMGRPVILYRPYSGMRSYKNWCIDDITAIYFDNDNEFNEKISRLINDKEYREYLQNNSQNIVRKVINNEEQNNRLKYFLNFLLK